MVAIRTFALSGETPEESLSKFEVATRDISEDPSMVFAFFGCSNDAGEIAAVIADRFPGTPYLGGTSCAGVINSDRVGDPLTIGLLCVEDADRNYGVATAALGDDPAASAEDALNRALADAGCPGELPELIWVFQAPGRE
jgi:hypothetical protein